MLRIFASTCRTILRRTGFGHAMNTKGAAVIAEITKE